MDPHPPTNSQLDALAAPIQCTGGGGHTDTHTLTHTDTHTLTHTHTQHTHLIHGACACVSLDVSLYLSLSICVSLHVCVSLCSLSVHARRQVPESQLVSLGIQQTSISILVSIPSLSLPLSRLPPRCQNLNFRVRVDECAAPAHARAEARSR